MAAPKSSSRKTAAKKKTAVKKKSAKAGKSSTNAKKAVKAAKRPVTGKKKVAKKSAPKQQTAKKKVAKKAGAKKKAAKKKAAGPARRRSLAMAAPSPAVAELEQRIAIVRNNLRDLTEMAAASSGASNEELASERIAEQEEQLRTLTAERDALVSRKG